MAEFGKRSTERLNTCHPELILLFNTVIIEFDCTVLCGHRLKGAQQIAFMQGKSTLQWPDSNHNSLPSMATDAGPWPLDWDDIKAFCLFAGWVLATARRLFNEGLMKHRVRWGGDWDGDNKTTDQRLNDLVHFELIPNAAA